MTFTDFFNQKLLDISWASLDRARKLKSCHSILLIGDGASLRYVTINRIPPCDIFLVNHSAYRADFLKYLPSCSFASLIEPFGTLPYRLYPNIRAPKRLFRNSLFKSHPKHCSTFCIVPIYHPSSYCIHRELSPVMAFRSLPSSSLSLKMNSMGYSVSHGSIFYALAFAESLSYKTIYLAGFDYLLEQPCVGHWFEREIATDHDFQPYDSNLKQILDFAITRLPLISLDPFNRSFVGNSEDISGHSYLTVNTSRPPLKHLVQKQYLQMLCHVRPKLYSLG